MNHAAFAHNIVLYSELEDILTQLNDQRIDTIVLKGAVFAETIYQNIGERVLSDLDLLVKPASLNQVRNVLTTLELKPFPYSQNTFIKSAHIPLVVDLHTGFDHLDSFSIDRVWQDAIPIELANSQTLTLSHEDNLVYLISHIAFHHGHPEPKWLQDINLFVRHYQNEIQWDKIIDRIQKNKIHIAAYHLFYKVQTEFQTPFPKDLLTYFKPAKTEFISSEIFHFIINQEKSIPFIDYILPIVAKSGIKNKFSLVFLKLFPDKQTMIKKYHITKSWLIYPYYVCRILDLLLKGLKGVLAVVWNIIVKNR